MEQHLTEPRRLNRTSGTVGPSNTGQEGKNSQNMSTRTLRQTLRFYLIDCTTTTGKLIDITIVFLNVLVCLLFVIETYPISSHFRTVLWNTEVIIVCFFVIEYVVRLYASENRLKYVRNIYSVIDLMAILPTIMVMFFPDASKHILFIQIIRAFKVLRIFRFLRFTADPHFFFGKLTVMVLKIVRFILTIFIIFFISSGVFFYVEHGNNPHIETFGDAFYYTVVTLTTVGFGDITPASEAGRWATVLMIISGIILIPWQAGQIAREWLRSKKQDIICPNCGLRYHDFDASHCKACGSVIYQEYDG